MSASRHALGINAPSLPPSSVDEPLVSPDDEDPSDRSSKPTRPHPITHRTTQAILLLARTRCYIALAMPGARN
jgi:hypothetical protein